MGSRGRIALGLIVLGVTAAVTWWLLRPAARSVFFAEIRFDQGFTALPPDASPFEPGLLNGFRFTPKARELHPATGQAMARGDLVIGLGWYRPEAHPPRQLAQTLVATDQPVFKWTEPGPALRAKSDRLAALAEPRVVELAREPEGCAVSIGEERLHVPLGEQARSKPRVRELSVDAAIDALRTAMPDLPEPSPTTRTVLALRIDPDGDGRVEIHEAYTITCHGDVDLLPDDLLVRSNDARNALARGDKKTAARELAALATIDPRDPVVRSLEAMLAAEAGMERLELTGSVGLPAGSAQKLIAEVTLWPADAGPEQAIVQVPAVGGRFRVFLPRGEYELQCRIPGHAPVRLRTKVPPPGEVHCALE